MSANTTESKRYRVRVEIEILADEPVRAAEMAWDILSGSPRLPICEVIETINIDEPENDNCGQVCVDLNELERSRKAIEQGECERAE